MKQTAQVDKILLTTLYRASSFVGSKRFLSFFNSEIFRFSGDPSALFTKLRGTFLMQMRQSLDVEYCTGWKAGGGIYSHIPVDVAANQIASQLKTMADKLGGQYVVRKADKHFIVPRNTDLLDSIYREFNMETTQTTNLVLCGLDTPLSSFRTFEIRNFLCEFGKFTESLHTLARETSNPGYEKMLSKLINNIDWFVDGYPHDILAHDAWNIRHDDTINTVKVRREYCSSLVSSKRETKPGSSDFMVFQV